MICGSVFLAAALRGDRTIPEVAALFGVSTTFVNKMLRLHRGGQDLAPRPHGGGHIPRLQPRHHKLLHRRVESRNDATLRELREHLAERNNDKRGWFRRRTSARPEQCCSKIKPFLRGAKARTSNELNRALAEAIKLVTKSDIRGWFKHCGYKVASV